MGSMKREQERLWACEASAKIIALRAKCLVKCDLCEFEIDNFGDIVDAYRLGNYLFSNGDPLTNFFSSRVEMTDAILHVVKHAPTDCPCCVDRD